MQYRSRTFKGVKTAISAKLISMNQRQLIQTKKHEILKIAAEHKASNISIFGSVARGDASQNSDIDFLVELDPDCN